MNGMVDFWMPAIPDPKRLKVPGWDVWARSAKRCSGAAGAVLSSPVVVQREAQNERDFQGIVPEVRSLSSEMNRDGERILFPLLGAAALVLLIACGKCCEA